MMTPDQTLDSLRCAALAALDKKADDLVLLDLRAVASFTGYFLLCTGHSSRQVQAIADGVEEQLARAGLHPAHLEGRENAEWVLLDYMDFIVHIFSDAARSYYDLERLWRRATRLSLPADTGHSSSSTFNPAACPERSRRAPAAGRIRGSAPK